MEMGFSAGHIVHLHVSKLGDAPFSSRGIRNTTKILHTPFVLANFDISIGIPVQAAL
jgi:hypothetical protein